MTNNPLNVKQYPIIGMSPGNSYFKDKQVSYLLTETIKHFARVAVLVPDEPAISTYIAYGYPLNKARQKALLKGNNLKNRVQRLTRELGIRAELVKIIDWKNEVQNNSEYLKVYHDKVKFLYESNYDFQIEVHKATMQVLSLSARMIEDVDLAIKIACDYLLSEIAFLEFAPQFLSERQITYVYHKNWPVYENYISGKFDQQKRSNLGFLLLRYP